MAKADYYNRYVWLMNTLLRERKITFERISRLWEDDWCTALPKRTFHQYRTAVERMFDVVIGCDVHNGYQYYISNIDDFKTDKSRQWLLNTFTASNLIEQGESIKERIVYEEIPEKSEYLTLLVDAMKRNRKLEITYLPYDAETPTTYTVSPYCMRLYHQHWYVLGFSETHQALRHFAVNRMKNLQLTDEPFDYPAADFSPEAFYQFYSGIYVDDKLPLETVRLRAYDKLWFYLRALPLHQSQTEVAQTDSYVDFEYTLRITPDFIQELLKRGKQLEVLAPESLKDRMGIEFKAALYLYEK